MKKSSLVVVTCLIGLLFLLLSTCKKDKQDFPEADFIKELKKGWFISTYWGYGYDSLFGFCSREYGFNGDSSVRYGIKYYLIGDPYICSLPEIRNLQTWVFTEGDNNYNLHIKDVCGGEYDYIFTYTNYGSGEQINAPGHFYIHADVQLIGNDTTITYTHFALNIDTEEPDKSWGEITFEKDDGTHTRRCILSPDD